MLYRIREIAISVVAGALQIVMFAEGTVAQYKSSKLADTLAINRLLDKSFELLTSNLDSAYLIGNRALRLSESENYDKGIGSAYMRLGTVMNFKGINDSALYYFHRALEKRNQIKDNKAIAASCVSLSDVFRRIEDKDSAFYYLFKAVKIDEDIGDSISIAQSYNTLGNLYNEYDDSIHALNYYKRSLRIYQNMHDTINIAFGYSGLGNYYYQNDEDTTALKYFLIAAKLEEKHGKNELLPGDYNNIALCYKNLHNYVEALTYYQKAVAISENNKEIPSLAIDFSNMGILYLDTHQTDSAIYYLQKGIELSQEVSDQRLLLVNFNALADAYAEKGDYKNAFDYNRKYSILNDSILTDKKVKDVAAIQAKFDADENKKEIQLLNQQNETAGEQRKVLIAGWALLLLVFGGSIYFFKQRHKLSKKNELIAGKKIQELLKDQEIKAYNAMIDGQEDERQRIANDLHDRLGSILATVKMHFNTFDDTVNTMPEQSVKQYKRANTLLDEACEEVRKISHNLSTGMIMNFGLIPALHDLCESVESSGTISCKLLSYGIHDRLDAHIEISIYRIVQELFSNILRHSQAKSVTIQLNMIAHMLTVTVEDDGIGFDISEHSKYRGLGLKSISLRTEKLNGNFTIDSTPGKGTIAILEIPVNTEEI